MELLSGFVNGIHLGRFTTRAADSNKLLLVDFVRNFRKFAVFAADILYDEFVQVADHVTHAVLTLNNGCSLRVGAQLGLEVLKDSTFWYTKGSCNFRQISYVRFDTIQSAFLFEDHKGHFVPKSIKRRLEIGFKGERLITYR